MCGPNWAHLFSHWDSPLMGTQSQISTTLLIQVSVILTQDFSRYLPSNTCYFSLWLIFLSSHQITAKCVLGSRTFVEGFPTFWKKKTNPNTASKLCPQFSSVTQLCLTLCYPMAARQASLSFTNSQSLFKPLSHPPISSSVVPFSSCLQSFPASGSFPMSQLFASGGQSIGISASASLLSMIIQDWLLSGWTGLISLQSRGFSRVFSNTRVQKHQFLDAQLSL